MDSTLDAVAASIDRARAIICTCCGGRHGRALRPGEHCDWCNRTPGHPLTPPPLCPRCATGRGEHHHVED